MRIQKITAILLLTGFLMPTCKISDTNDIQNHTLFADQDFKVAKKLNGRKLSYFKLNNPRDLHIIDTLFITVDRKTDYLINVYNLKTGKKLNNLIKKGKGPFELISLDELQKQFDTRTILAFGTKQKKVIEFSYNDLLKAQSEIDFKEFFIKDQGCMRIIKHNEHYIGLTLRDSLVRRLYFYDNSGKMTKATGEYPKLVPLVGNMLDGFLFNAYLGVLPNNKIALSYKNMDLIELYNTDYRIIKRLRGPGKTLPSFQLKTRGDFKWIGFNDDQISAYGKIITDYSNNEFWVPYSGRRLNEAGYLKSIIYVFGQDGSFHKKYSLDIPVFRIDVDFKNKIIYAINYPELDVYEFKY